MRYWEILESVHKGRREALLQQITPENTDGQFSYDYENRPRLTLRHLQKYRIIRDKEKRERTEYLAFLPIMYADPQHDKSKIEKPGKSKSGIEKQATKIAMQLIKDRVQRERKAGDAALHWATTKDL